MTAHEIAMMKMNQILERYAVAKEIEWPEPMTAEAEQERREFLHNQVRQSIEEQSK